MTVREWSAPLRLRGSRDPEALRRVRCVRCRRAVVCCVSLGRAAPSHSARHVPRLQRRFRPSHHHLLAGGAPLPSRWVSGHGDAAAAELPRHGLGLPAPLPAEWGRTGPESLPPLSLAASGEGGAWRCPLPRCLGTRSAWPRGVRGEARWEPGAAAVTVMPAWGPGKRPVCSP